MTELESRTLCVDIDQTLCVNTGAESYASAEPIPGARETLAQLRSAGWVIVLFTGRHFNHWQVTVDWLRRHDFPYDQIAFGKPPARFYIDDRAIPFEGDWSKVGERLLAPARGC